MSSTCAECTGRGLPPSLARTFRFGVTETCILPPSNSKLESLTASLPGFSEGLWTAVPSTSQSASISQRRAAFLRLLH